MKVEISDSEQTMSINEVVDALINSGDLILEDGEKLGEARLECGCDLDVDILVDDPSDPRIDGTFSHTEEFTLSSINDAFDNADYCVWAKDENGDDILICFGAC